MISSSPEPNDDMPAVPDTIRVRKDGGNGTIILDRPDRLNALNRRMVQDLQQVFSDLHQEKAIRTIILTGAGDTFCSGTDLDELKTLSQQSDARELWGEATAEMADLIDTMLRFPKPIIAAVNGQALGTGAGLVLASDIVIAGETASIGWPELQRGLVPNLTLPLLQFRIGAGVAAKCMLTGLPLTSQDAHEFGLFHELVADHLVWARATELGNTCALSAPQAIQLTKQMLYESIGENLFSLHAIGAAQSAAARTTEAASEGIQAFLEKRKPDWTSPKPWSSDSMD